MMARFRNLIGHTLFITLILYSGVSAAWEEKSEMAAIQPNAVFTMPGDPKISAFRFSAGKVYLLSSGEWKVEGWLKHKGVLCGTYEIGVQFGEGTRGCDNVKWITDPQFVTNRKHCNNSNLEHKGFARDPLLETQNVVVSCARRIIRCSGTCKTGSGYISNNP